MPGDRQIPRRRSLRGAARALADDLRRRTIRWPHPFDDFESRIVWLVGSPRSGSTWLLYMLAEHPNLVVLNEPQIGYYLGPFLCDLPGTDPGALDADTFTIRRLQADQPQAFFASRHEQVWGPDLARLIANRFRAAALTRPRPAPWRRTMVVVKEPNGSQSADVLLRVQPRSRLLFLLRDGRDVVDSELAANAVGSWVTSSFPGFRGVADDERLAFVVQSAHKWLWRTEMVQEAYRNHPGPKLLVRYEELLRSPAAHLRDIFDWLGLSDGCLDVDDLVRRKEFEQIPESDRGPSSFFRAASPGQWSQNLTPAEQAAVHAVLAPKLAELGYDVSPPVGDATVEGT